MLVHCDADSSGSVGAVANLLWPGLQEFRQNLPAVLASISWFRGVEVMKSSQVVRGRRVRPGLGTLPGPRPLVMGERLATMGDYHQGRAAGRGIDDGKQSQNIL